MSGWSEEWVTNWERDYGYDPERAKELLIEAGLPGLQVASLEGLGCSPDAREALTFAVLANETLKRALGYRGNVGIIASEEDNEPRVLQEVGQDDSYIVMFDPLDGSSNIDANVTIAKKNYNSGCDTSMFEGATRFVTNTSSLSGTHRA